MVDQPIVSSASTVGSLVVEVGDGIVSLGHTSTLAGGASWLTHLKVLAVDPLPAPIDLGGQSLTVLDGSAATWSSFQAPELSAEDLTSRGGDQVYGLAELADGRDTVWFPAEDSVEWEDAFLECQAGLLGSESDIDVWEGRWSWLQTPWVVWAAPSDQLARSLTLWPHFVAQRKNLVVEMGITELSGPGGASREVARGRLCMESGSSGYLLFGDLVMLPRGYDVDVATGAAMTHPTVASVFDGLYLRAAANGVGETVTVSVASAQLRGLEDVPLSTIAPESFARPSFALSDARVRVPVDGQRRMIAELDGSFDRSGSRTLWVSVHAR
jgi:hypothetical protein